AVLTDGGSREFSHRRSAKRARRRFSVPPLFIHIEILPRFRTGTGLALLRLNGLRRGRIAATCIVSRVGSMNKINAICVYCGSSPGTDPAFVDTARDFGKILAQNGIRLVYGGGSIGLMGALASSVIDHGGAATGIIPEFLTAKERPRRLAQEQINTPPQHRRQSTSVN